MSLNERFKDLATHFLGIAIDSAFLVLWVALQAGIEWVIGQLPITGVDAWVLTAFKWLFGLSTLAPVIFFTYSDLRILHMHIFKRLRETSAELELPPRGSG